MFRTTIRPRVSETDGAGHINNTTVPVWFEAGREELFKLFTPDLSFDNWRMVVIHFDVEFVSQIFYGTEVEILTRVKKIGNTSLVLYEELHQDNRVCAKGHATYVNYNFDNKKSEPISPRIRERLEVHKLKNLK